MANLYPRCREQTVPLAGRTGNAIVARMFMPGEGQCVVVFPTYHCQQAPLAPFLSPSGMYHLYQQAVCSPLLQGTQSLIRRWSSHHHWFLSLFPPVCHPNSFSLISSSPSGLLNPSFLIPRLEIQNPSSLPLCLDPLRTTWPLTFSRGNGGTLYPHLLLFPKGQANWKWMDAVSSLLKKKSGYYENVSLPLQASCVGGPFSIICRSPESPLPKHHNCLQISQIAQPFPGTTIKTPQLWDI